MTKEQNFSITIKVYGNCFIISPKLLNLCLNDIPFLLDRDENHSTSRNSLEFLTILLQSTPNNSNLQGKSKKVRVIGSSKKIAGSKVKNSFYCTVNILITFYCRNVK